MMHKVPDDGFDYLEPESDPLPVLDEQNEYTYPNGVKIVLWDSTAADHGFCPGCGSFVAGTDYPEHVLKSTGVCDECLAEINEETGLDDDDYHYLF